MSKNKAVIKDVKIATSTDYASELEDSDDITGEIDELWAETVRNEFMPKSKNAVITKQV